MHAVHFHGFQPWTLELAVGGVCSSKNLPIRAVRRSQGTSAMYCVR